MGEAGRFVNIVCMRVYFVGATGCCAAFRFPNGHTWPPCSLDLATTSVRPSTVNMFKVWRALDLVGAFGTNKNLSTYVRHSHHNSQDSHAKTQTSSLSPLWSFRTSLLLMCFCTKRRVVSSKSLSEGDRFILQLYFRGSTRTGKQGASGRGQAAVVGGGVDVDA